MSKTELSMDPKDMPTAMLAAWNTAGILLVELVKAKGGGGQWFEELKAQLESGRMGAAGDTPLPPGFEAGTASSVYRDTVRSIFDRVRFTNDPNEATDIL